MSNFSSEKPPRDPEDSFLRTLFSWPNVIIVVIIGVVAFVALFYAEENWRGKRAWKQYRESLEARGERVDLREFVPASASSEENFADTPLIQSWFPRGGPRLTNEYDEAIKFIPTKGTNLHNGERRYIDLVAWEMALKAVGSGENISPAQKFQSDKQDFPSRSAAAYTVLNALTNTQEAYDELREASRKPHARYPINYDLEKPWGIPLPHLAEIKRICQQLELKACAELAAGSGEMALADVQLILRLADSLKDEPFLICYLVRIACVRLAIQPVWEGLAERQWSDGQLQELQKSLGRFDLVTDAKWPLRAERACSILTIDSVAENPQLLCDVLGVGNGSLESQVMESVVRSVPRGWFHHEQVSYCQLFDQQFGQLLMETNKLIQPKHVKAGSAKIEKHMDGENLFPSRGTLARLLLPGLGKTAFACARAQTALNQATVACALERYHLAKGDYPEELEMLVSQFANQLPIDVLTGDPYKYRRTGEKFVLYSPGWNETDEGGVSGKDLYDEKEGDWVWRYNER